MGSLEMRSKVHTEIINTHTCLVLPIKKDTHTRSGGYFNGLKVVFIGQTLPMYWEEENRRYVYQGLWYQGLWFDPAWVTATPLLNIKHQDILSEDD